MTTATLRKLLLEHKMLTPATMRREAYTEFLRQAAYTTSITLTDTECRVNPLNLSSSRRLLANTQFKDVTFHIGVDSVSAHKCILSARSSFLKQQFEERWRGRSEVSLSDRLVSAEAFRSLLEWLYTGQVDLGTWTHSSSIGLPSQKLDS